MSIEVRAQNTIAMTSVKAIKDATEQSALLLAEMEQYAEEAGTTLTGIYQDAEDAKAEAERARTEADNATTSAETAMTQLTIVEDVLGVLDLISKHGSYAVTEDTEVVPDKWYFTRTGTSPDYVYQVVTNPTGNPHTQGWYELTGIDETIRNYVSNQLYVDGQGLWLKKTGIQTKILLSATDGVVLYGTDGAIVGKYGATAQIGDSAGFHIEMDGTELGFYQASRKVAYISNNQLYITQSVVLQQMDLGVPINDGGLGQWSWKVHANGETPSRNNLNLKWIG